MFIIPKGEKAKVDQDDTYFDLLNTIKLIWEYRIEKKRNETTTYTDLYNQRITKMSSEYWTESKANYEKAVNENKDPRYVEEISLSDDFEDWFGELKIDGTRDNLDDDVLYNYDTLLEKSGYNEGYPASPYFFNNPFNIFDYEKWKINFDVLEHSKIWRTTPEIVEIRTERRVGDYYLSNNQAWNSALNANTIYDSWDPRETIQNPSSPTVGWVVRKRFDDTYQQWGIRDKVEFDLKVEIDGVPPEIDDYFLDHLSHRVFLYYQRTADSNLDINVFKYPKIETNIHTDIWDFENYTGSSHRDWIVTNHENAEETDLNNIWTISFKHTNDSIPDTDDPPANPWSGYGTFQDRFSLRSISRPLYLYRDLTNELINEPPIV